MDIPGSGLEVGIQVGGDWSLYTCWRLTLGKTSGAESWMWRALQPSLPWLLGCAKAEFHKTKLEMPLSGWVSVLDSFVFFCCFHELTWGSSFYLCDSAWKPFEQYPMFTCVAFCMRDPLPGRARRLSGKASVPGAFATGRLLKCFLSTASW